MKTPAPLDLARTVLRAGVTLIEASAGTGKTFAIAGLFLRLLLEQRLSVSEILVVTYTEAATEELRGRIRQTLTDALRLFGTGSSDSSFLAEFLEQRRSQVADDVARLEQALSNFDEAPIFTIHGFCQRQLKDRAFESGALFDTELITDPSGLLQEMADDYWRRNFYEAEPLLVHVALANGFGPERLLPELELHNRHPELRVISRVEGKSWRDLADDLRTTFQTARELWLAEHRAIRKIFADAPEWAVKDHAKPEVVEENLARLERCFSETPTPEAFECLSFFCRTAIQKATGKHKPSPTHRFFEACEDFCARETDLMNGLRLDFIQFARAELPGRKQLRKVQTFDDLLTRLHAALTGPGGERLGATIRAKYKAALIDEFQDTDPAQYQIFRGIFVPSSTGLPDVPLLFLIGDPKQAIYGFRGADFFTYLDAARRADQRFTLNANWRSETGLVRAVNTLFQCNPAPFVFGDIPFHPVVARGKADAEPLREDGRQIPPLHFWFFPRDGKQKEVSQATAEEILPDVVASEIARLLNGNTRLGNKPLGPEHIAVLVLKHSQAALLQKALQSRNIPSVLHTEASLFASEEARELHRVLAAVEEPANERLLRVALGTRLLGFNGLELEALTGDEAQWQNHLERFHRYSELWTEHGFTPMLRALLHEEQVRPRILSLPEGERRLTNVLHLAEALHRAAAEQRLGPAGLQQWLAGQIASENKAEEEHQLRLERDDFAVKLVTIHKSKGLEYPVVFCPFISKSSDLRWEGEERVFFHERPEGGDSRFVRDLGSEHYDEHRALAFREKLAENVRLLYVALTRARNRCYVVWGNFRGAGTSAPAWLLHHKKALAGDPFEQVEEHLRLPDNSTMRADLERLVSASMDDNGVPAIQLRDLPSKDENPYRPAAAPIAELRARVFNGTIERDWRVTSFSGLAAHRRDEEPDYDPVDRPAPTDPSINEGIFAFPRGTNAGTCLHKICEAIDFTASDPAMFERVTREQLRAHGFDENKFSLGITECLRRTMEVSLDPARTGFKLAAIPAGDRLNELEFSFPLQRATPALLQSLFKNAGDEEDSGFSRLNFDPVRGYLQGFIDLVFRFEGKFYILDWKSNWLGGRVEDYHGDALAREMRERHYLLQYHLYTLALHQYLALRLPNYSYEKHFGGVFYLFLRGMDPGRPELGVFRDRPPAELIEKLAERLITGGKGSAA